MPIDQYCPADLEPLNGATRLLEELGLLPCIDLRSAGEAFTLLASGADVPERLRRYYEKVGKGLTITELRLKKYLQATEYEGQQIARSIASPTCATYPKSAWKAGSISVSGKQQRAGRHF